MTLIAIVMGTLAAGIGSVWLAAVLSFGAMARYTQHMLSLAAGALMSTAFMHLLPEAFESDVEPHDLFLVLLIGLVFFFLLDKAELWHHGHEHHGNHDHHDHSGHQGHQHAPSPASGSGSWAVLAGDSVHCFGDGILIASAFMADLQLGAIAALSVLAHEVPHHVGDLTVLRSAANTRRAALIKVSLAGAVTTIGGLLGYWLLEQLKDYQTYFLVMASSSFVYVALADLIPQLQKHLSFKQTVVQVFWLLAGIAMVVGVGQLFHAGH